MDFKRKYHYPTIDEVGVKVPAGCIDELFRAGWDHSIRGGNLTEREHLKKSFRYGFREARLYLNEVRRARGVVPFPMKAQLKAR